VFPQQAATTLGRATPGCVCEWLRHFVANAAFRVTPLNWALCALGVLRMNWDAISAISETLGALGVIASLIYLATQLRSNAVASAVEAKLATTRFLTEFNRDLINNPDLYDLWDRGGSEIESLSREEYIRFSNLNLNAFWFFSAGHFQKRVGKLESNDFYEMESIMKFWISRPGVTNWWRKYGRDRYNPKFVEYVDTIVLGGDA
jgi:hypothetical protein